MDEPDFRIEVLAIQLQCRFNIHSAKSRVRCYIMWSYLWSHPTDRLHLFIYRTLRQFISSTRTLLPPHTPVGPWISNGAHAYSQVFCSQATSFSAKTQHGQTTTSHLALFFFFSRSGSFDVGASSLFLPPLVPSYLKIIFGWGEWGGGPRGPEAAAAGNTQVGAAGGWVSQVRALTLDKKGRAKKWGGKAWGPLRTQRARSNIVWILWWY